MEDAPKETPPAEDQSQSNIPPIMRKNSSNNGLAIAAMVVGIIALLFGWAVFFGLILGIVAIVLGIVGLKKPAGKGMSIAGIVTGSIAALFNLVVIALLITGVALFGGAAVELGKIVSEYSQEQQDKIDAKKDFAKGETAVFDDLEVKVNSVTRDYTSGSEFIQPGAGNEFIVVNVTVKNKSDSTAYVGPFSFNLNSDGSVIAANMFVGPEPRLDIPDLAPESEATGNVVYEVAKGADNLKLQREAVVYDFEDAEGTTLVYTLEI